MRQQGLFPAGVSAFNPPQLRIWVIPVDHIQKHQPRIPRFPGHFRQQIKHLPGVQLVGDLPGARVHQTISLAPLDPFHKVGVNPH